MKKRIAILGSTGSIGRQTLAVIASHPDLFEAVVLTANTNVDLLAEQAAAFGVRSAVICREDLGERLGSLLAGTPVRTFSGMDAACELVAGEDVDIVVTSTVGFSGLRPTLAAIRAGKTIALANKETLVAAGSVVMPLAAKHGVRILPVDSEHSAIFQCLMAAGDNAVSKIHLTASGGPFRTWPREKIAAATKEMALKHPSWNMGDKITIDSATMMNKGFEVIEARWLFDVSPSKINVVIHPESVIHSMIEFEDGAVIAQMGMPDMREPIQFALSYPRRLSLDNRKIDFTSLGSLTFFEPSRENFPCLGLAFKALERGGNIPCAMNAANEVAVAAYLRGGVRFYDIPDVIARCMDEVPFIADPSEEDIFRTNDLAVSLASKML